ncbi:MAG: M56 family metallopeptidase [Butyrivibrio sp.]|nr:M56 family metallopeptidase [Butyrivibrio sp.]
MSEVAVMQGMPMFFEFVCVYYSTILGFCAIISFFVMGIIMALRSSVFAGHVFGRAALWCMLIPVLFCGKLRAYFETRIGVHTIFRWYSFLSEHRWMCTLYMAGIIVFAALLIYRRVRLKRLIRFMPDSEDHLSVYPVKVFSGKTSSFCLGCFKPVIVVPDILQGAERGVVIKHEETHIRLGHLWILLVYDILRTLLWPNILLHLGVRYLKRDLEDICDLVTIQRNNIDTGFYGRVILDCAKDMSDSGRKIGYESGMSFTTNDNYRVLRKRLELIVRERAYNSKAVLAGAVILVMVVCVAIGLIKANSYKRTNDMGQVCSMCYPGDLDSIFVDDDQTIVTYVDDEYISINAQALLEQYPEAKSGDGWFYFSVGGYYKIPGIGGGGGWGELDAKDINGSVIMIPNHTDIDFFERLIMWL